MESDRQSELAEQLERLNALRASGSITDDEFQRLKSALIARELGGVVGDPLKQIDSPGQPVITPLSASRVSTQDVPNERTGLKVFLALGVVAAMIFVIAVAVTHGKSGSTTQTAGSPSQVANAQTYVGDTVERPPLEITVKSVERRLSVGGSFMSEDAAQGERQKRAVSPDPFYRAIRYQSPQYG